MRDVDQENTGAASAVTGVLLEYRWLRQGDPESTPLAHEFEHLEPPRPEIVWPRTSGRVRVAAKKVPKPPPTGAAEALRMAITWSAELESGEVRRADIARRERLSRARVTQILRLTRLPEGLQSALLAGTVVSSIREALRGSGYV